MPVMSVMFHFSWPVFLGMYWHNEGSANAGGLLRWPVMLMLPLGFLLMMLQGAGEIIKRIGWLTHTYEMDLHYERPLQ